MKLTKLLCLVLSFTAALPDSGDALEARSQPASSASELPPLDTIPDVIFTGESKGSRFTVGAIKASGDLNGDEYTDIVIGATGYNDFQGRVYIYFGGKEISTTPDLVFTGETSQTAFGRSLALGDLNNDGYDDLVIGAWRYNSLQGRAYLYYGGENFDEVCDKVFEEEKGIKSEFGVTVAFGDVNNDGYADLAIYADAYKSEQGRVYLYYGVHGTDMDTTCDKILDGEEPYSKFGRYLAMGEDVDGDGYGDLLVGAPMWNNDQGRAYFYHGGPGISMNTTADLTFTGEQVGDRFGRQIGLGDINGDGHADIIIGAAHHNRFRGRAYVYYGATRTNMDATCDLTIDGVQGDNLENFGIGVAVGDIDSDGDPDLLLGGDNCYNRRGRVYLYYGGGRLDGKYDLIFDGPAARICFGRFMDIGDVNGDNYTDIVIGAWSYPSRTYKGRAYLYYGGPRRPEPNQLTKSLLQAAADGDIAQVKSVISKAANVNAQGKNGNTPLHRAAESGHKDVAELLIENGADIEAATCVGDTALHLAAHGGHKHVAALLIGKGADVNARRHFGGTPLHTAVWGVRNRKVIELLLANGADVNAKDTGGDTPLHYAAGFFFDDWWPDRKEQRMASRRDVVELLLAKGAHVNSGNIHNETLLHWAVSAGHKDAVELLIAKGADVNIKNKDAQTPLVIALSQNRKQIVELLRRNGAKE